MLRIYYTVKFQVCTELCFKCWSLERVLIVSLFPSMKRFCIIRYQPSDVHAISYPHRGTKGGGGGMLEPRPRGFEMLQYFVTILPSVASLWSSLQDEVYFMGSGAAGGLWRHQQWSPPWPPSWILQRIRNQIKTAINSNFLCSTCKIIHK